MTAASPSTGAPDSRAIVDALDGVRRRVRAHAGDVEVVSVSDEGDVLLAFSGTCTSCPAQAVTLGAAVLPVLERLPGVRTIAAQGMNVSPAAMQRIRAMFGAETIKREG